MGAAGGAVTGVQVGGEDVAFRQDGTTLTLPAAIRITPESPLTISLAAVI